MIHISNKHVYKTLLRIFFSFVKCYQYFNGGKIRFQEINPLEIYPGQEGYPLEKYLQKYTPRENKPTGNISRGILPGSILFFQ